MAENKRNNEEQYSLEEILNENFDSDETFSLESILAEFKSQAYMDGDKRTPSELLQKRTDDIINEVRKEAGLPPVNEQHQAGYAERHIDNVTPAKQHQEQEIVSKSVADVDNSRPERPKNIESDLFSDNRKSYKDQKRILSDQTAESRKVRQSAVFQEKQNSFSIDADVSRDTELNGKTVPAPDSTRKTGKNNDSSVDAISDDDLRFFENFEFSDSDTKRYAPIVEDKVQQGEEIEESEDDGGVLGRLFGHRDRYYDEEELISREDDIDESKEPQDMRSEAARFAAKIRPLRIKSLVSVILCILMLVVSQLFNSGRSLPFGIGTDAGITTGILLIMQMLTMIAGIDVLISGFDDIVKARPGVESLVLISNLLSVVDGFVMLMSADFSNGLPFSLISSWSLFFAIWARKSYYMAMCDSIKSSLASTSPFGVISEDRSIQDRAVLKKIQGATKGFYSRLIEADFGEVVYNRAAPLFIVISIVFGVITSVARGRSGDVAHTMSIMATVSAAFPAAMAFALPFRYASVRAKRSGSAIAGWGGASDIYYADGALLTDDDIFPVGSVSMSGLKLFEGVSQRKAIIYTSSLIIASGSGLTRVFQELLKSQGYAARQTNDFACYDGGGLGAIIDGERILVGTGAFMNLMGIRVPDSVNDKNSVFTAINGELAAVFTINYVPANSVRSALISLLNTKTNILFAVRDFNVTPNAIQQKFKVSMEGVEFVPIDTVYKLSDVAVPKEAGASAILCRGGLAPFAEVITRGRFLKTVTELNTLISVAGSIIGLLIMLFLCWNASFSSASVMNVFLYMLVIEFCVLLSSQVVRKRL